MTLRRVLPVVTIAAVLASAGPAWGQTLSPELSQALREARATLQVTDHSPTPDGRSLRSIRGVLTDPADTDAETILQTFLSVHGSLVGVYDTRDLQILRVRNLGESRVVRLQQVVEGAPVIGAHLTALIDVHGRIRLIMQSLAEPTIDGQPMLTALDAARIASREMTRPAGEPAAEHARLVYLPVANGVRPAFAVYFGAVPALLANWRVFVDAETGAVIGRFNHIMFDRTVLTWSESPAMSELLPTQLETIDMDGQDCIADDALPPLGADGEPTPGADVPRLCTSRISARSCWDHHETISVEIPILGERDLHTCTEYHMAVPNDAPADLELAEDDDLANDFLYTDHGGDLDYDYEEDELAGEDLFAEVNLFHHAELIYDHFRSFDESLFTDLREGQLMVSANWRIPLDINDFAGGIDLLAIMAALTQAEDTEGPLFPFDNAMYVPSGNIFGVIERPMPSLMFFQGNHRDFAYDSDVIYHEFGHAVVGSVVDGIGLTLTRRDAQGLHRFSMAMNESYADFFATDYNDNSQQGEYALGGPGMGGARDLAARPRHACPERLINEEHHDSAPYSEALWEVRESLETDAAVHAIFSALCTLPPDASFGDGATATIAAIEAEMGTEAASTARDVFASYGYDDDNACQRVLPLESGEDIDQLALFSTQLETSVLSPYAPSLYQIRVEVPSGTRQLIVHWRPGSSLDDIMGMLGGSSGEALPGLLVKHGETPIEFSTSGAISSDADVFIESDEDDPRSIDGRRLVYHLEGEELPAGPYHLMLVNSGEVGATLTGIWVERSEDEPEIIEPDGDGDADGDGDGDGDGDADADGDADGDGDGDADGDADGDGDGDDSSDGGCSCRSSGAAPAATLRQLLLI